MLLYIIRHGDPDYSTDTLTERGKLQAEAVGKRMLAAKIDRIYTSPMGRARETAAPACRLLGMEAIVEDWSAEIGEELKTDYPDGVKKSLTFVPNHLYRENGGISLTFEEAYTHPAVAVSGMHEAVPRIARDGDAFLERLGYKAEDGCYRILRENTEKIALFCHSAMARAWLSTLLHIPLHMMWSDFLYTHTGVTVLEFKNYKSGFTAPRCLCYSDMSHLYAEGLDMIFDNDTERTL